MRPGDTLGPYQISALIGAGGMGEVFRARDPRLQREVAVKVLPPNFTTDPDRLQRFDQEAKTLAALNHPNLLMVFDTGTLKGAPYMVSEFLEGRTLREELNSGPVPIRKALDYALQIANGLAGAHAREVVHRDIKPENIFITNEGRVKILDFGLAKLRQRDDPPLRPKESSSSVTTIVDPEAKTVFNSPTEAGIVMGTPAYMSPEQVTGKEADHRSDIFSFGTVLYEMLSGQRAFRRGTSAETMTAILREEPEELAEFNVNLPTGLDRVVRRCLEKRLDHRFQSASDLAFALENVGQTTGSRRSVPEKKRLIPFWVAPFLGSLMLVAIIRLLLISKDVELTDFRQVTFRRGTVMNARFSPDGERIFYGARWNMNAMEVFESRPGTPEARPLNLLNADVLSVSPTGELALLLNRKALWWFSGLGTLARTMPGGTPREVLRNVKEADWHPNATNYVVVRDVGGRWRMEEYPGALWLGETSGTFSHPRYSHDGEWIAYIDHKDPRESRGTLKIVNREGQVRSLTPEYTQIDGLAWHPNRKEIWFTAITGGENQSLRAVNLKGEERQVMNSAVNMTLHDMDAKGRLLMTRQFELQEIIGLVPPETHERNLTTMSRCVLRSVTQDGTRFLVLFFGEGSGDDYTTYLNMADGSQSIRLGSGLGHAISPDGKWVFANTYKPLKLFLMSTGPEEPRKLSVTNLTPSAASWLPDNRHLVVYGQQGTNGMRYFLLDTEGGEPKPLTPEGVSPPAYFGVPVSPDGRYVIGGLKSGTNLVRRLYPLPNAFGDSLSGGVSRPLPEIEGYQVAGWSSDSKSIFVHQRSSPVKISRYELATGKLEPVNEIFPPDLSGSLGEPAVTMTHGGGGYVYFNWRVLTDLFVVEQK